MPTPLYLPQLPAERASLPISDYSAWRDNRWLLGPTPPGTERAKGTIDWNFDMPDGSKFCDPAWSDLLEAAKLFLWSLHADPPPHARAKRVRTLYSAFVPLRIFIRWMAAHGFRNFAGLHVCALNDFFADMASRPGTKPDRTLASNTIVQYAILLKTLYRQGQRYPMLAVPEPRAAMEYVSRRRDRGSVPCTPDEIAIPLLSSALRLIEKPADDVISVYLSAQAITDAALRDGFHKWTAHSKAHDAVSKFRFSTLTGEDAPWHPHPVTSTSRITYLVDRIVDAAFVLIAYFVGMRASEILGLQAGCVQPRPAIDPGDPPNIFNISGRILKTSSSPAGDPHRWTAPACAARAIAVLERLSQPLRARTGLSDLWLATPGNGLHNDPSSIYLLSTTSINRRLNEEFAPFIRLPLYRGEPWHLSSHQGRKKFASFVARRDRTGLDALRAHLGHRSITMTDSAYVGNDPSLSDLTDDHIQKESHAALVELLMAPELGGPAGQRIARNSQFRGQTADADVLDEATDEATFLLEDENLTLGLCDWGYCLYRRPTSACLGDDSGPNPVFRSQDTCIGCYNFAVTRRHLPVWQERLSKNLALLKRPNLTPTTRSIAQRCVDQCRKIIAELNASPKPADDSDAP